MLLKKISQKSLNNMIRILIISKLSIQDEYCTIEIHQIALCKSEREQLTTNNATSEEAELTLNQNQVQGYVVRTRANRCCYCNSRGCIGSIPLIILQGGVSFIIQQSESVQRNITCARNENIKLFMIIFILEQKSRNLSIRGSGTKQFTAVQL